MLAFSPELPFNQIPDLPPNVDLETPAVFKACIRANRMLAELKGSCHRLPNPEVLLNTLVLQESKESSAIENIVTTHDELFQAALEEAGNRNQAAKEVLQYRTALFWGIEEWKKRGVLTTNLLVGIMQRLRDTRDGIRRLPGTVLLNPLSGQVIYTPPEGEERVRNLLASLEGFMHETPPSDLDPLIKMALIHYQFEAIHPFADGNGRTGRILNILYLIHQGLLDLPVLYLSGYIIRHRSDYYRLLREVTEKGNWVDWVLFLLQGIAETAETTLAKIEHILLLRTQTESRVREALPTGPVKELTDLLFSFPYIKIKILEEQGISGRQTASRYLTRLEQMGLLRSVRVGKTRYFIHDALVQILSH